MTQQNSLLVVSRQLMVRCSSFAEFSSPAVLSSWASSGSRCTSCRVLRTTTHAPRTSRNQSTIAATPTITARNTSPALVPHRSPRIVTSVRSASSMPTFNLRCPLRSLAPRSESSLRSTSHPCLGCRASLRPPASAARLFPD